MNCLKRKLIFIITAAYLLVSSNLVFAAPSYDQTNGLYTDDFVNNSGVPTRSYVNVNTSTGKLQLTNTSSQTTFTTPYRTSGYAYTSVILPTSVAEWGQITFDATIPDGTTLKIQVYDYYDSTWTALYEEEYLPGNATGFSSSPIDISNLLIYYTTYAGGGKIGRLRLKITMTTTDTSATPTLDNLQVTWTPKQGDLSASPLSSSSPWPVNSIDNQNTKHSQYKNPYIYTTFKWANNKEIGNSMILNNYIYDNKLFYNDWWVNPKIYSLNRDTGEILWSSPFITNGWPSISENGTWYEYEIVNDALMALDLNTHKVKWTYQFSGGHGNNITAIDDKGVIYFIYAPASSLSFTVYAMNPNGTVKWTKPIDFTTEIENVYKVLIGHDGNVYLNTYVMDDTTYEYMNLGRIYSLNPDNGDINWYYETGDTIDFIIDENDVLYTANYFGNTTNIFTPKMMAINSDGSLKWEKEYKTRADPGGYKIGLNGDLAIVSGITGADWETREYLLEAYNLNDGTKINTFDVSTNFFTDNNNGLYTYGSENASADETTEYIKYYDGNSNNLRWKISYTNSNLVNGADYVYYDFEDMIMDERGWLYGGLTKSYYDSEWNELSDNNFVQYFALSPWTLTNQTESYTNQKKGDTLNFSVKTSMLQTNTLLGGNNQMQVVMDNGDKVALNYSSTDANNDTIWTGSYTLPTDIKCGSHTYTIEAAQTYLQTDVTTHFASAPTESNNTGITTTGTFTAFQCSGGGLPPGAFNPPKPGVQGFKISINNQDQKTDSCLVNLELTAGPDTKFMSLSNDKNFTNATLEPYQLIKSWDLCAEAGGVIKKQHQPGEKTVYAKFYTEYGYSSAIIEDKIILIKDKGKDKEPQVKGVNTQLQFTYDLYYGLANNQEVKRLQEFLISKGYLEQGFNTGNYYRLTQDAVRKLQKDHNITPANGRFGPLTRALVNKMIN